MRGLTLDAGALIAFDRNVRRVVLMLQGAAQMGRRIAVPAGALAQAWRDGRRQARLASFLAEPEVDVVALDDLRARQAGQLCGVRGTSDIVDASVVLCARARNDQVITSDPDDLARLDPSLDLIEV